MTLLIEEQVRGTGLMGINGLREKVREVVEVRRRTN